MGLRGENDIQVPVLLWSSPRSPKDLRPTVPEEPEGCARVPEELSQTRWTDSVFVLSGLGAACAEPPTRGRGWKLLGTHLRWVLKSRSAF